MKMFIENCANSYNATLGHNWFLNIANYLHERKKYEHKNNGQQKINLLSEFLHI